MKNLSKLRLSYALCAASLALIAASPALSQESVRIGYVVSKTGANAGGATTSTIPNYELWVHEINEAGGIQVGDQKLKIEVVEYDDRSSSEEAVRAVERLATQDKVDFILTPWGTGNNLAVGPIFDKYGYPQIAGTSVTDRAPDLAKRWPNSYWLLGTGGSYAEGFVDLLVKLREEGKIGDEVAMASIADGFGIELSTAGRTALQENGFKLVYDQTYPLGTQDLAPIVNEVKALNPDVFIAFSYPPDTLGLTDQARVLGFNPKIFYTGVATAFPLYKDRFKDAANGVVSLGGIDPNDEKVKAYIAKHKEVTGKEPDRWASFMTYAGLQALQQSIEQSGTLDKEKVSEVLRTGTFDTVLGNISFDNENRQVPNIFTVGQWQDGEFVGLVPTDKEGSGELVFPKPEWPAAQ
ncbi:amino acid ABC transporter substrate-binding protein [Aquamicrobium sp. LC103]|uniref:amino acid ABC transporter substrate-binding protein n=1 Tax=Aquamicrobium sp. LC103 TaxID=1120658 RepID=UPI00069A696C|nr:amino acid ABC transporter substrate-binding protein [Aquamicrobium sp. LC103]TKT77437.1 twin-arginine translocation pathway signal protein [Aquamicrobium sp. LC103]